MELAEEVQLGPYKYKHQRTLCPVQTIGLYGVVQLRAKPFVPDGGSRLGDPMHLWATHAAVSCDIYSIQTSIACAGGKVTDCTPVNVPG